MGLFGDLLGAASVINPVGLIGTAIAGGSAIADYFSQDQTNRTNAQLASDANQAQAAQAQANRDMEVEFAKNGITWRIEDAARNGISPLAALGASEPSFSPVQPAFTTPAYTSPFSSVGSGLRDMGQNLSRALTVTKTPDQLTSDALDLVRKRKENDLLDAQVRLAQINVMKASQSPGIPLAYRRVMNADGTTSVVPAEGINSHNESFGPLIWSLHNGMIPSIESTYNLDWGSSGDVRGDRMIELDRNNRNLP